MSGLLILGAGGHAKVVAETALASGLAPVLLFLTTVAPALMPYLPVLGWPVIGPLAVVSSGRNRSLNLMLQSWPSVMPPRVFTGSSSFRTPAITCPC